MHPCLREHGEKRRKASLRVSQTFHTLCTQKLAMELYAGVEKDRRIIASKSVWCTSLHHLRSHRPIDSRHDPVSRGCNAKHCLVHAGMCSLQKVTVTM